MTETDRKAKETRVSRLRVHSKHCDSKRVAASVIFVVCTIALILSAACFWRSFQVSSFLSECDYSDKNTRYNLPTRSYWYIGDEDSGNSYVAIEVGQLSRMYNEAKRDTIISALISIVMIIGAVASARSASKYSNELRKIEKEYTELTTQLADERAARAFSLDREHGSKANRGQSKTQPKTEPQKIILKSLDLSTKEGIEAAPTESFEYNGEIGFVLLNQAAKNHKKNGNYELATLCYQKMSNVLYSDEYGGRGGLIENYWKDLYEQRRFEEADFERKKLDSYYLRNSKKRVAAEYAKVGNDLYTISPVNPHCPKCFFMDHHWHDLYTSAYPIATSSGKIPSARDYVVGDRLYCDFCDRNFVVQIVGMEYSQNTNDEDDPDTISKKGADLINKRVCEKEYDWINRNMLEMKPQTLRKYMSIKHNQTEEYIAIRDTAESMGFKFYPWVDGWYQETFDELGLDDFFGANTYYTNP